MEQRKGKVPNVVMLTWEYPPHLVGGLARHVYALSQELKNQGLRVHVLTRYAHEFPETAVEDGVEVHRVRPYFQEPSDFRLWVNHLNFGMLEAGIRLLEDLEGPVILHAHDWLVAYAAKGLKNLFRVPMVATIHATEHGRHRGIHDPGQQYINDVEWWLTYEAWRVIVCSHAMRSEVQGLFGLSDDKVSVIPNGIHLPPLRPPDPKFPRSNYAGPHERIVFHIGRLVPEKGAGVLLEALPLLLQRHPVKLVIGGVGPYADELKHKAQWLGIADRVYFAGWMNDQAVQALYQYADVAVVPSTYEPFGIVALEAMAAGAPLVVTDVGGLGETVRHEQNGLKALPGNPASLAQQIDRMLSDRSLASRLASAASRDVRTHYTWANIARTTAGVYRDVQKAFSHSEWGMVKRNQAFPPTSGQTPGRYTM